MVKGGLNASAGEGIRWCARKSVYERSPRRRPIAPPVDMRSTPLPGLVVLRPRRIADSRGFFSETYNRRTWRAAGLATRFVQDNHSLSVACNTVRGLHFQRPPSPQAKLVSVIRGSIFDVAVDIRTGSPTYGRWTAETLSAAGGEQLFLPHGFAHGFCTLEPDTEIVYKIDGFYDPDCEDGILWSDPTLAIEWPVPHQDAVLSDKDRKLGLFAAMAPAFRYDGGAGG